MTDYTDLAKRAVACKRWRWMPGMLAIVGVERQRVLSDKLPAYPDWLPDLNDPATLGCLEQLVCDAHGVQVWLDPDWRENGSEILAWSAVAFLGGFAVSTFGHGPNKATAWVSALEAAND